MAMIIMQKQLIFSGQVKELLNQLELWQQKYQTLKELLHSNLH
ncbi:MAG: hypothetical protein ACOX2Q_07010 [Dehalobacterium sp.]|jgi:hypothetical protein